MKRVFKRISEGWENLGGGWELCGKGGGRETRRDWEKLGGTRRGGRDGSGGIAPDSFTRQLPTTPKGD